MSRDVKRTISLSTRLFSLPRLQTMLLMMVVMALAAGATTELLAQISMNPIITLVIGAARGAFITLPPAGLGIVLLWRGTRGQGVLRRHRLFGIMTIAAVLQLGLWALSTFLGWIAEQILTWAVGPGAGSGIARLFFLRGFILGSGFALALIFLTVLSTTTIGSIKGGLLSLVYPTMGIGFFLLTDPALTFTPLGRLYFSVYLGNVLLFLASTLIFLFAVGRPLKKAFNVDGMQLFRGFLSVWMEGKADLMEACFSQIGQRTVLPLGILRFSTKASTPQLVFIIAGAHPGPFKNTGSSALPSEIAQWGRETLNVIACAPHSTSTHDLNLVNHDEVDRLMDNIQKAYNQTKEVDTVSQFVRATSGTIQVGCQLFGDTAFLIITRSPHEMDDISLPVGKRIAQAVKKEVKQSIIVDAHNCMTELKDSVYEDSDLVTDMITAAVSATQQAQKAKQSQPRLGVATRLMPEYTETQGMGPEGITAVVIEVANQRTAYVIIDGNNMVVKLREKLVQALVPQFVEAAEILTTDTHQTTRFSRSDGYSPIGLDFPQETIIETITELVQQADNQLEPVRVATYTGETSPLHVMGEGTVEKLTKLITVSAKVAKRGGIIAYSGALVLSLLLLILI